MSLISWIFGTGRKKEKDFFGEKNYEPKPYSPPAPYSPTPYSPPSQEVTPSERKIEEPASREKRVAKELGINVREVMAAINYQPVTVSTNVYSLAEAVKKLEQAEEVEDEANKKILIIKIDELAQAELSSADNFQKISALYELLPQESKLLNMVVSKWLSYATTKNEIEEVINSMTEDNPEKNLALNKLISAVKDFEEAEEIFQRAEKNTPEEAAAIEKWLTFASDFGQALEIFEVTAEDTEAQKLAFRKCLSLVSDRDEAGDLFNGVPKKLALEAFEKWLSLANTIEEIENVYNNVSGSFEKMAGDKLQSVVIAMLANATSFEEVEKIHDELSSGVDAINKPVLRKLISLATDKDQMAQIHSLAGNDSDSLQEELEEEIVAKWLLMVTSIDDVKEVYDATVTKEADKMAKDRLRELFSIQLAAADTFEKAEEAYNNCPEEEGLEKIALERMIALASKIGQMVQINQLASNNDLEEEFDKVVFEKCFSFANSLVEIEEMHDNFPMSGNQEELVLKKWISLAQTIEDMDNIPLGGLDEDDEVYREAQTKKDGLYLEVLASADQIYRIQEIVSNVSDDSVARKTGNEKWLSLVSNAEEAEEFFCSVSGEEMETLAVKKWLTFSNNISDFYNISNRTMNAESEALVLAKWNELALEALKKVNSVKEAKELLQYFPGSGEARRELIKRAYNLTS